jgi:hypothetical protein
MRLLITQNSTLNTQHFFRLLPLSTQNSKLKTQNFLLCLLSVLALCLFSSPCFAQVIAAHLPHFPNLPTGEKTYDTGGASPYEPEELDAASHPIDAQGELKTDADGVKANKYKIDYTGNTGRIQGRIDKSRGAGWEDSKIENGKKTRREDLEPSELPEQTLRLPDARSFGFQHQSPSLGRIGLDTGVGKANSQAGD